jgi:hypothetical protein
MRDTQNPDGKLDHQISSWTHVDQWKNQRRDAWQSGNISLTRDWEWSKVKTTPTHDMQHNDMIVVVDPGVV